MLMALNLPPGLTPPEIAFLCEMELVTVIPRQRLEGLELLGGPTPTLQPPHRTPLPLWLALLLKRQKRANIAPPSWLHPASLEAILKVETENSSTFSPPPPLPPHTTASPPFLRSATDDAPPTALPYHYLELSEQLLSHAADDLPEPDLLRVLLRDLREVRMAKMRAGTKVLDGAGLVSLKGVGVMEVGEGRGFISGVVDGLRVLGKAREIARREREGEAYDEGDEEDDDMGI